MRINRAIKLDHRSEIPIFEQLGRALETDIERGVLEPGQMLPSSREFARSLLLSRGTVVRAYKVLISKGLVRSAKGKGLIVSPARSSKVLTAPSKLQDLVLEPYDIDAAASESEPEHLAVEDVTKAAVPQGLLPVRRWRELTIQHCKQLGRTYQIDALGSLDLRNAVCRFLTVTRGLDCTPEQISVYTNTDQALDTIARLLVKPNDTVIVEEPGYIGVSKIFAAAGAHIIANGIDDQGMVVENLAALTTRPTVLYVTPIGQDPTGIVMTEERQTALIEWARKSECLIVEDGWDTDFWHSRPAAPCVQHKAPDRIIYLYSFWKLLFPISNACFLVVPPQLTSRLRRLRAMINRPPISLEMLALTDLLRGGEIDALAIKLQKSYRKRRQALMYNLSVAFGKLIEIATVSGGTHIIVRFSFEIDKARLLPLAARCGLKMISLDDYYFDGRVTEQYIIFFTNVSADTIGETVQLFKDQLLIRD